MESNSVIAERLQKLRYAMAEQQIDYYLIPTADFHDSEYVNDYFKVREYFSGFTGSAGMLLVEKDAAYLWTDGRYFIQAAMELEGTGIVLMRQREEGVPTLEEFLTTQMKQGQTLGFDGRVMTFGAVESIQNKLKEKEVSICYDKDLAETIWTERPKFPAGKVFVLSEELAGKCVEEKINALRQKLKEKGADAFVLSKLDDIMWLCNIRGCDVECNPVAYSYFYLSMEEAILFLQDEVMNEELSSHLEKSKIIQKDYSLCFSYLKEVREKSILLDQKACSFLVCNLIQENNKIINAQNPTQMMKAVKNETELEKMRTLYLKDSLAVTKFIYWLKKHIKTEEITEITAADRLEAFRREIPEFFDLSFPTISGYGPNAAMMHYEATAEKHAKLCDKGFLLVDSGGQYMGATTDVTRTISLGELTEEEKEHYTLVAAGMIQMTNAKFLYGCTGRNLDILARAPLWEKGLDYKCGTGHGVGYILNVHEGPQALRWQYQRNVEEAVLEEGMDVTNEPGIYVEGKHGIRIENVMVVQKAEKNENGQFMEFETLTFVPLDKNALVFELLNSRQKEWIIKYQETVYQKLSPFLSKEEKAWLWEETRIS